MGWAAGFRAGTAMSDQWMDTYNSAKDRRVTREVEEELQGLRDEKQGAARRYDDKYFPQEYGLPSYLQDGSLAAAAQGEQPAGLGAQPPVPLRSVAPEQAPTTPTPNPNQVPPNSIPPSIRRSDTASRPPRPDRPKGLSDLEAAQTRVQRFREEGRIGLADQEQARLDQLEDREYRRGRDKVADERWEAQEERAVKQFDMEVRRLGYELENMEEAAELRRLTEQFSGMPPHEVMKKEEYKNLAPHQKAAIAGTLAQMSRAEMDAAQAFVDEKVAGWKTWDELLTEVNKEDQITDGTYYKPGQDEKGRLTLQLMNDDDTPAEEAYVFETQSQRMEWLRRQATEPGTVASYYETVYQNMQTRIAEQARLVQENRLSATDSITKEVLPLFNDPESPMGRLKGSERAKAIRAALALYEPYFEAVPDANGNPTYPDLDRYAQGKPEPDWDTDTGEGEDAQPRPRSPVPGLSSVREQAETAQRNTEAEATQLAELREAVQTVTLEETRSMDDLKGLKAIFEHSTDPAIREAAARRHDSVMAATGMKGRPPRYRPLVERWEMEQATPGKPQGLGTPQAATTRSQSPSDRVIDALIMAESDGDPNAVSPVGAQGLTQVMPATGRDPGFGVAPLTDPFDPVESRRFAKDYLGAMLERYNGDMRAALVAYNAGPRNADRFVAAGHDFSVLPKRSETEPYVRKIMGEL